MFKIYYMAEQEWEEYATEAAWLSEIEDIEENTPWDIDFSGKTAIIDNGDPA